MNGKSRFGGTNIEVRRGPAGVQDASWAILSVWLQGTIKMGIMTPIPVDFATEMGIMITISWHRFWVDFAGFWERSQGENPAKIRGPKN